MKKIINIISIFILCPFNLMAQQTDTSFLFVYPEKASAEIFVSTKNRSFAFFNQATDHPNMDPQFTYHPNTFSVMGVQLSYKFLSMVLSSRIPYTSKNEKIYGKPNYIDLDANGTVRFARGNVFYSKHRGMYYNIPKTIMANNQIATITAYRNDLEMEIFGAKGFYVFNNRKFSLRSIYCYSTKQLKNVGSVLAYIDMERANIQASSSISFDHSRLNDRFKAQINNLSAMLGYAYVKVFDKKYFINPMGFIGPKYAYNKILKNTETYITSGFGVQYDLQLNMGCNIDKYYIGIMAEYNNHYYPLDRENIFSNSFLKACWFLGYRFL